jgi:hypothetical protein
MASAVSECAPLHVATHVVQCAAGFSTGWHAYVTVGTSSQVQRANMMVLVKRRETNAPTGCACSLQHTSADCRSGPVPLVTPVHEMPNPSTVVLTNVVAAT